MSGRKNAEGIVSARNVASLQLQPHEQETWLYFVRHAHSVYEHGRELERGLSAAGEAEARALCARLGSEDIEYFVSSPYRRAARAAGKPGQEVCPSSTDCFESIPASGLPSARTAI